MSKSRRICTAVLAAAVAIGCAASARPATAVSDEAIAPGIALASFDSLWSKVRGTYVDTAFVSTTWMAVRDSLRPRAATITSRNSLARLFAEMLRHIPDSHFYIIPASAATDESSAGASDGKGTTGLSVRLASNGAVAWRVEPGSAAARAGIVPGEIVTRVGAKDARLSVARVRALPVAAQQRALSELLHALNGALSRGVGDSVRVEVASGDRGLVGVRTLVAAPAKGTVSQFGNLPPIAGLVRTARIPVGGSRCVGTIAFNIWLPVLGPDLQRAVDSVRSCDGVIVDLRGNPGGVGAMVMGFGGYFVDSTRSLGTMRTRLVSLEFVINPRRSRDDGSRVAPFIGPLAILVDPMTASTSEIFATGMQRIARARVFGERSAGAALPALMERLPSGDVFVHAVADFTDPSGRRIEGAGVVPDELVPLTRKDLAAGKDAPLEAAIRWIIAGGRNVPVPGR